MVSRALELFTTELLLQARGRAEQRGTRSLPQYLSFPLPDSCHHPRTLTPAHIKEVVLSEPRMDFLRDLVTKVVAPEVDNTATNSETDSSTSRPKKNSTSFSMESLLAKENKPTSGVKKKLAKPNVKKMKGSPSQTPKKTPPFVMTSNLQEAPVFQVTVKPQVDEDYDNF